MIEQRLKHCRHPRHRGGLDPRQCLERLARLKPRQHRDAAAIGHGPVEHAGVGEDMEQRQDTEDHITVAALRIDRHHLPGIGGQVLVSQHRALGGAGGPAGILQQREILDRINRHRGWFITRQALLPCEHGRVRGDCHHRFAAQHSQCKPLGPRQHPAQFAHDQPLERRSIEHLERGRHQCGRIERDQHPRTRIADLRGQFVHGVKRAEIDQSHPSQRRSVIGRNVNRHIGQEQPDPVAPRQARQLQIGGESARFAVQLGIAEAPPQKVHQGPLRIGRSGSSKHIGQTERRQVDRPIAGVRIVCAPRLSAESLVVHVKALPRRWRRGQHKCGAYSSPAASAVRLASSQAAASASCAASPAALTAASRSARSSSIKATRSSPSRASSPA